MKAKAKRFAKYYDQCRLPKWVMVLGVVLLAFGIVAAGVTAIFHDKYSSIFGAWETALTNVWFIAFVALVGVGALISLGYPLLSLIGAGIWVLFSKDEPEVIAEQPAPETPVVKEEAHAVEEAASVAKQPTSASIDEARLRRLLNTPFMRQKSNGSEKTNLDRFIDDVKTVRIQHQKGAKDGINDKSITSIAKILFSNKYQKQRPLPSFAKWNTILFECLNLEAPQKGNINKSKDLDEQITKLFGYLIPSD
jgi:hypothetical protein